MVNAHKSDNTTTMCKNPRLLDTYVETDGKKREEEKQMTATYENEPTDNI